MAKTAGRILKADEVKVEGTFVLDVTPSETGAAKQADADAAEPQVRILESRPDHSIIEITCSCGTSLNLRCEYAAPQTPHAQTPDPGQQAPAQAK
jgi:hypothetical protein